MNRTKQLHRQRGFTMIEMIGVLAVIAILASIVAPKIFDAIRDSKVNTFASNIQAVQTAVASYYKDTGTFPSSETKLITDTATGWKGPYLDKSVADMFTSISAGTVALSSGDPYTTVDTAYNFDIDGDGAGDYDNKTAVLVLSFSSIGVADAKSISGAIDGDDANTTTGGKGWWTMGRFKNQAVPSTSSTEPTTSGGYYAFIAAQ
ncbi:MAG: prepilin-type N-terminal cleavage/methylation domain-containing protein [Mariprofundales bacterium]|nr:prepilin-type N-terminal cleavage/methylation domain-containing protein [Mariprofundales bacterium]